MAIISIDYLRKTMNQLKTKKGKENTRGSPRVPSSLPIFFPFFPVPSSNNTSSFLSSFISRQTLYPLKEICSFSFKTGHLRTNLPSSLPSSFGFCKGQPCSPFFPSWKPTPSPLLAWLFIANNECAMGARRAGVKWTSWGQTTIAWGSGSKLA